MRVWLKELRLERGKTQQSVADEIGITKQYYQQIEAGIRQLKMSTQLVVKFADVFDLSPVAIMKKEQDFIASISDRT